MTVGDDTYTSSSYTLRRTRATKISSVILGGPVPGTSGCYANIVFGALQVFLAPKPVLDIVGIITGNVHRRLSSFMFTVFL